jgi:hypothetical protein
MPVPPLMGRATPRDLVLVVDINREDLVVQLSIFARFHSGKIKEEE